MQLIMRYLGDQVICLHLGVSFTLRSHLFEKRLLRSVNYWVCQQYLCITELIIKNYCILYIGARLFPSDLTPKMGCVLYRSTYYTNKIRLESYSVLAEGLWASSLFFVCPIISWIWLIWWNILERIIESYKQLNKTNANNSSNIKM